MKAINRVISLILSTSLFLTALPVNISAEFIPTENTRLNNIHEAADKSTDIDTYCAEDLAGEALHKASEHPKPKKEAISLLSLTETVSGYCGAEGDGTNLTWALTPDGMLTISGSGVMADYNEVWAPWAEYSDSVHTLVLSEGITSIGFDAFYGMTSLTGELVFPESLIEIGDGAFYECASLSGDLVIPDSVTEIKDFTFYGCSGLDGNFSLGKNTESIGVSAFCNCSSLTGPLNFPETITYIGEDAFYGMSSLTGELNLPESLIEIGDGAFYECTGLSGDLVIPDSITEIKDYTFYGCTGLDGNLTLSKDTQSIGLASFYGCSALKGTLSLPESITHINDYAFYACSGFTGAINLPDGLEVIAPYTFWGCSGFDSTLSIPASITSIGEWAFYGCSGLAGELVLPAGLKHLGRNSFFDCSGFTGELIIPAGLTEIGISTFYNCSGFTGDLIIPDKVTSIGNFAFENCTGFDDKLIFPVGLTEICYFAFAGCSGFSGDLYIPATVTHIENFAFSACDGMKNVYFLGDAPVIAPFTEDGGSFNEDVALYYSESAVGWTDSDPYNAESSTWNGYQIDLWIPSQIIIDSGYCGGEGDGTNLTWIFNGATGVLSISGIGDMTGREAPWETYKSEVITVTIGNGVTSIGNDAFRDCDRLATVTIPDSVTSIESSAFDFCKSLTNVTIPDSVTYIGYGAFEGCDNLTTVTIGKGVTFIGNNAFMYCPSLTLFTVDENNTCYCSEAGVLFDENKTTLIQYPGRKQDSVYVIPDSVTSIDSEAFLGCSNLTSVTIPDSVTSIGVEAFSSCDSLTSVTIGNSVTSIGYDAFYGCDSLTSVIIPDNVAYIDTGAFGDCHSLTTVTIGNGVTSIGVEAFSSCESLTSVTIGNSVTAIDYGAFEHCKSLTSVTIPDSVTSIGRNAFSDCGSLFSAYFIGNAPGYFGYGVFNKCADDFAIYYVEGTSGWTDSEYYDAEVGTWHGYKLATWTPDESCSHNPDTDPSLYVGSTFAYMDEMHHYVTGDRYVKVCTVCDEWYDAVEYPRDTSLPENQERHKFDPATGYCWACGHICQHSHSIEYEGDNPVAVSGSGVWKKADDTYCKKYVRYWMVCAYCGNRVRGVDEYEDGSVKTHNSKTTEKISQLPESDKNYTIKHWVTTTYTACTRNCGYTDGNKTTTTTEAHTFENGVCAGCGYTVGETAEEGSGKYQYMIPLGGKKISFNMPDSVPFVGGDTFSLAFPHVPLSMKTVGDKVYVGINCDLTPENEPFDSRIKAVKKFINRVKGTKGQNVGNTAQKEMNYLMQDKNQKGKFGKPDVSLSVLGYGEGTRDETGNAVVTVYLYVSAELKETYQGPTIVLGGVLPVTYSISFQGSATSESEIQWNPAASTFTGEATLTLKATAEAFGGAGIGKVVAAGVYGSVSFPCEIQLISSVVTPGVNTLDMIGELGAKAYLGPLEYKKFWAQNTWYLYSRSGGWLPASMEADVQLLSDMYNMEQYALADLSYLSNESPWAGDTVSLFSFSESNELIALQSDTYRNMQPVLGNAGGIPVMVWVRANTERGTYDYPELVYSVYENGIWSAPAVVDDNATLDSAPAVCTASDGTLWIVYQDTREALSSGDIEELIKKQTIRAARFDVESGAFTDFKTLSTEGVFSRTPILTNVDGILTALWVENSDNSNYFGTNATNRVCFARYVEGGWTSYTLATGLNAVTEIAAGYCVDSISAVVVTDEDNDLSTQDDRILTQYDGLSDDGRVLESGMIASPVFAVLPGDSVETLLWSDGTHLKKYDAEEITAVLENDLLCDGFTVLQDRIVFNAADGDGSNLFASIWDGEKWSTTVQMTTQEQYLQSYSITNINGAMWLAAVQADVSITESDVAESCTLSWAVLSDNVDLGIDNVHVDHSAEALNSDVPVFVDVTNYGTTTISEYTVAVGSVIKNVKTDIAPGETATVELEFPLGETVTTTTYTASVTTAQDCEAENDSKSVTIGYADLATKVEFLRTQETQEIMITVSNTGVVSTAGDMVIELPAGYGCGYSIPELAPGESCVFSEAITIEALGGEISGLVSVLVGAHEAEWDELNNDDQVFVTVYPEETVAVSAISESAATLNIHSSRDALVYLAIYSAEGQLVKIVSAEIAAGEEEINLNIDLAELPHDGTVKAFLLEKQTFMPICNVSTWDISSQMAH